MYAIRYKKQTKIQTNHGTCKKSILTKYGNNLRGLKCNYALSLSYTEQYCIIAQNIQHYHKQKY